MADGIWIRYSFGAILFYSDSIYRVKINTMTKLYSIYDPISGSDLLQLLSYKIIQYNFDNKSKIIKI